MTIIDSAPGFFDLPRVKKGYFAIVDLLHRAGVKDKHNRVVKPSSHWTFVPDKEKGLEVVPPAAIQKDGYGCGVMTAMAGFAIFLGFPYTILDGSVSRIQYYRKFIAHTLLHGFIMADIMF